MGTNFMAAFEAAAKSISGQTIQPKVGGQSALKLSDLSPKLQAFVKYLKDGEILPQSDGTCRLSNGADLKAGKKAYRFPFGATFQSAAGLSENDRKEINRYLYSQGRQLSPMRGKGASSWGGAWFYSVKKSK